MSVRLDQLREAMSDLTLDDSHIFHALVVGALSNHVNQKHWERAVTLARDVVHQPMSAPSLVATEQALTS